jgi:hypothetical protein
MRQLFFLFLLVIFVNTQGYAAEAKGYKVVLASFPKFDDAKEKLKAVGDQITDEGKELQYKYHFKIVARASGRAFVVSVEPMESEEAVVKVLHYFKKTFPDAYGDKYYGPTKGTIFLEDLKAKIVEVEVEVNTTKPAEVESKAAVTKSKVQELITPISGDELSEDAAVRSPWIWWSVMGLFFVIAGLLIKRRVSYEKKKKIDEAKWHLSRVNGKNKKNQADDEKSLEDIFYRFLRNKSFLVVLRELKSASDDANKNICLDKMTVIMKYQQGFRKSNVISAMSALLDKDSFAELSMRIDKEIKGL